MEPIYEHEEETALELPAEPMRLNMGPSSTRAKGETCLRKCENQ